MDDAAASTIGRRIVVGEEVQQEQRLDQWEALNFDAEVPQWSLKDIRSLEPAVVRNALADLQSRFKQALQEIEKLRGTVSHLHREASLASLGGASLDGEAEEDGPLWKVAWEGFRRGFTLTYFVRTGLGLTTRVLQVVRQGQWRDLLGWGLLSESGLNYREDAIRLGLFIGGFTSLYQFTHAYLKRRPEQRISHQQACMIAGTVAGLSLVVQDRERRRTLALYVAARVAQCWYNSLKNKGEWQLLSSSLGPSYGDSLLFAFATSQVMYAYVMRPHTLPRSYWNFIVRTGPIHRTALQAVRRNVRGRPIDVQAVNDYIRSQGELRLMTSAFPSQIPSFVLHPWTSSALANVWRTFATTFRKTFPLYFSISVVPFVVLNFRRALRSPLLTLWHALTGAARSTTFLSTFVASYMGFVSLHRAVFTGDFKLLYWLAGMVASAAILIEKKGRRSELALYVLPRAVESLLETLLRRRVLPKLPFWEVGLFALCMGRLMYYKEHEPSTMAPFLSTFISRIVLRDRKPSVPRTVSKLGMSPVESPIPSPDEGPPRDSFGARQNSDQPSPGGA